MGNQNTASIQIRVMTTFTQPSATNTTAIDGQAKEKKSGFLKWVFGGCVVLIILLVICVVIAAVGLGLLAQSLSKQEIFDKSQHTSDGIAREEQLAPTLQDKLDNTIAANQGKEFSFSITEQEILALIASQNADALSIYTTFFVYRLIVVLDFS